MLGAGVRAPRWRPGPRTHRDSRTHDRDDGPERADRRGWERDELARLASSFNHMLAALDESLATQRLLVAGRVPRLRTPSPASPRTSNTSATAPRIPARGATPGYCTRSSEQLEELRLRIADLVDLARRTSQTRASTPHGRLRRSTRWSPRPSIALVGTSPRCGSSSHLEPTLRPRRSHPYRPPRAIGICWTTPRSTAISGVPSRSHVRDGHGSRSATTVPASTGRSPARVRSILPRERHAQDDPARVWASRSSSRSPSPTGER